MAEVETLHFFKRNVNLSISVRFFRGDHDGVILNAGNPLVEVKESNLKEFKQVNKNAILQGLIKEVDEPEQSWETDNDLSDDDIQDLLSNWLKLKNKIDKIDSVPVLYKLLEAATEKGSARKVTEAISNRIAVVEPPLDGPVSREQMGGSNDVGNVLSSRD